MTAVVWRRILLISEFGGSNLFLQLCQAELGFVGSPELCKACPCSSLILRFVFLASKGTAEPNPALVSVPGCFQTCWDVFMGMVGLEWPSRLLEPLPAEPAGSWLLVWCPSPGSDSSQVPNLQEFHLSMKGELPPMDLLPGIGIVPLWSHPNATWMCPCVTFQPQQSWDFGI